MAAAASVPNLYDIPLRALRPATVSSISALLNPPKVLATSDGLPRDWRGLAHLMKVPPHLLPHVSQPDPTGELLKKWTAGSVGLLDEYLGMLDRWDIVDDTKHLMEADAVLHLQNVERALSSASDVDADLDREILTRDDVLRLEQGLPPQRYNAYLLYADADEEFAVKIIEEMENKYNLKLCVRDRDLVAGHVFEHEAIMRLISDRCNRLIVVISENFLKSEANKFFCTFAQALGIDQKRRKVIPVMHKQCRLPPELNYYFVLDYTRSGDLWDFWKKLHDSIETPSIQSREPSSRITIREPVLEEQAQTYVAAENSSKIDIGGNEQKTKVKSHEKQHKISAENIGMKKSTSMSLENLKAKSKKWFGGFPTRVKKNKKAEALVAL
uniref:Adaptor protein Myd88 n=1 Tax=Gryllus bimaculatus TaxID=6999 RepID=A0A455R606_GRYBI|nr:adaptor protein Myd88 [Gryllus bimaculatus]